MFRLTAVLMLLATVCGALGARSALAACDPTGADATAIADARTEVAATCDCAGATSHRDYVSCSSQVLRGRVNLGQLGAGCRGFVQRCAVRSTCGKPGA